MYICIYIYTIYIVQISASHFDPLPICNHQPPKEKKQEKVVFIAIFIPGISGVNF